MPPLRHFRRSHVSTRSVRTGEEERIALIAMVNRIFKDLAMIVSARGLCACQAARIAHLPPGDLDLIASSCTCPACLSQRLH